MSFVRKFKSGDTVFHRPTGETWSLIRNEQDGWVYPSGWPQSMGRAEDCKLVVIPPTRADITERQTESGARYAFHPDHA